MYLRDGAAQAILRAATLRYKLQTKRSTSPSHSILTPGRPVPAPGGVATGVPSVKSLTRPRKKSRRKRDSNQGSSALEEDALTTRPTRRSSYLNNEKHPNTPPPALPDSWHHRTSTGTGWPGVSILSLDEIEVAHATV